MLILGYILGAVALLVVVLLIIGATRPAAFRITRSATMSASPTAVFEQVNDFQNWRNWSPWEGLDPELKRTYGGAAAGETAIYAWSGDKRVGEGRMTILESKPGERIGIKLEFLRPFKATNAATFTFTPTESGQTDVRWDMEGRNNLMLRVVGLFMNMDKLVGRDFEKGLAKLKSVVESTTP